MSRGARRFRSRGFTLLEVVLSIGLLALVMGGVVQVTLNSQGAFRTGMAQTRLMQRSRRAVDQIVTELTSAGRGTISPPLAAPLGGAQIDFQRNEGWAGGAVQWSPTVRFSFEYVPGEADNGLDDNGNGLVDEGQLVRTLDPGGAAQETVLLQGISELLEGEIANGADDNGNGLIDEGGLSFVLDGNELIVRMTVVQPGLDDEVDLVTIATSVALMNP